MKTYVDAPRFIDSTPEFLRDWFGPVIVTIDGKIWMSDAEDGQVGVQVDVHGRDEKIMLDPMRAEVRDHLIRRLRLPGWVRDSEELQPWKSAGLILAAANVALPLKIVNPVQIYNMGGDRHSVNGVSPPYISYEKALLEKEALTEWILEQGHALLLSESEILLPWLGGPRVWKNPTLVKPSV